MMGIFYCLTVLAMLATFVLVKKSNKKVNLVNWCILSIISYLGFNIAVCMIFGTLNIKTSLLFLSIINLIVSAGLGFKIYKDKCIQSFEIRKRDFLAVIIVGAIICYIAVDQYVPLSKSVANASVDACNHYIAAVKFADNSIILSKIDNQTGYNLKTMQTGAYINNGIFMSVVRSTLSDFKDYQTFKIFEIGILALNALAFYMLISEKLKTKENYLIGIIFLVLYAFAYPYTSLLYGFSYLSISIAFATGLFYVAKLYGEKDVNFYFLLSIIVLMGVGIIFSYCLFVPALFAFICIYAFIKDFGKKEEKSILKIFKKSTLIITGILLLVTVLAILYLVVPTFIDTDQNKLTDAIGFVGGCYKSLYQDFLFYIPFVAMFIYKSIKNKDTNYQSVALALLLFQTLVCFIGLIFGIVSAYYYYKIYYILWILFVEMAVEVMCDVSENKELMFMLKTYMVVWVLIILGAITGAKTNSNIETRLLIKSPYAIDDTRLSKLAGIYYDTNIEATRNINVSCIVNEHRVALAEAMGQVEDMTLKNMLVGGMNTNSKAWIYVISGIESGGESINDLQKAVVETGIDDWMKKDDKKYFVLFNESEKFESTDDYEVIFSNEAGAIFKKLDK
jgi:hypothetical protein